MEIKAINSAQTPKRRNAHVMLATAAGASVGALSRYVLPAKKDLSSVFNKDTFSKAVMSQRAQSRSILRYAGIGAVIAGGLAILKNIFQHGEKQSEPFKYSKYGAMIDAPDYAVEIMYYGE